MILSAIATSVSHIFRNLLYDIYGLTDCNINCRCLNAIKDEETAQYMKTSYEELIAVKKENVALQLEGAYRSRINEAYQQVSQFSGSSYFLTCVPGIYFEGFG